MERNDIGDFQLIYNSVYLKLTFTAQYLNSNSVNTCSHKIAVVKALFFCAKIYCSYLKIHNAEIECLRVTRLVGLKDFFLSSFLILVQRRLLAPPPPFPSFGYISILYVRGMSENTSKTLLSIDIKTSFQNLGNS